MNFDYTYIQAFDFLFFEPMVVLTNGLFFLIALFFFKKINSYKLTYAKYMARFILMLGISTLFGAVGHTVHYQLGKTFFDIVLLIMNSTSMFSVYFLFRASNHYYNPERTEQKLHVNIVLTWILMVLAMSWLSANFTLIKIHAAAVLLYTLYVHFSAYRQSKEKGNEILIIGILVSFVPILIHSLHISLNQWFNHKDLAHVFMILSLIIIYKGLHLNVRNIQAKEIEN